MPYLDPVVPLILALYGHPDAGGFGEQRCEEQVKLEGWEPINNWPGLFWHPLHKALLIVYVEDFKMAAPAGVTAQLWKGLKTRLELDEPDTVDRFLGCYGRAVHAKIKDIKEFLVNRPSCWKRGAKEPDPSSIVPEKDIKLRGYEMREYLQIVLQKYCER